MAPEATAKTLKKSRNQTLSARVSFLSIEFGAGGASKQKVEFGTSGPAKHIESSAQRWTRHMKFGAEVPAKTLKKSRNKTLSAPVRFLRIEFGVGGASKNKSSLAPAETAKSH